MKTVSLVVVPSYLLTTMKSVNISLADLNVFGADVNNKDKSEDYNSNKERSRVSSAPDEALFEFLKKKLSGNDIHDLYNCNELFYKHVLNSYGAHTGEGLSNEIAYLTCKTLFSDKSAVKNSPLELVQYLTKAKFIISEDNYKEVFSFHYEDNTLFLILKDGFGNLISCNRSDLKDLILDLIIEQLFNKFGETATVNSGMFSCYFDKLLKNK